MCSAGHLQWDPGHRTGAGAPGSTTHSLVNNQGFRSLWAIAPGAPRAATLQPGDKGILPWKAELLQGNKALSAAADGTGG